jgi:chemotaxis signal transduction protein
MPDCVKKHDEPLILVDLEKLMTDEEWTEIQGL